MFNCRNCGKNTSHKISNRRSFCNSKCFAEWAKLNKLNSKKEKRICLECKIEFECIPSSDKKFCKKSCSATFNNKIRDKKIYAKHSELMQEMFQEGRLTGLKIGQLQVKEGGKTRGGKKVKKQCLICNKEFFIQNWKAQRNMGKYCSNECARKRPNQGGYRPGSVRNFKSGWYTSHIAGRVWLDSSYEFVMAEYLDEKKYKWIKNHKGFPYVKIDGSGANYVPDFYIEDLDLWVETKGYMTENDKQKMKYFPHKIKLIGKKEIYEKEKWGF